MPTDQPDSRRSWNPEPTIESIHQQSGSLVQGCCHKAMDSPGQLIPNKHLGVSQKFSQSPRLSNTPRKTNKEQVYNLLNLFITNKEYCLSVESICWSLQCGAYNLLGKESFETLDPTTCLQGSHALQGSPTIAVSKRMTCESKHLVVSICPLRWLTCCNREQLPTFEVPNSCTAQVLNTHGFIMIHA